MQRPRFAGAYLIFLAVAVGCATNPVTGEKELSLISEAEEISLGTSAAAQVEKELGGLYEDEALQEYLQVIGEKIASASDRGNLPYQFRLVNSHAVNALALPGGKIYITKGLFQRLENEAQLAAVLGHEAAHVCARHAVHHLQRALGVEVLITAVSYAGGSSRSAAAATKVSEVALELLQLRYSRKQEYQADEAGVRYAYRAGYDPYEMIEVLSALLEARKGNPSAVAGFFSTHPLTEKRIEGIRKVLNQRHREGFDEGTLVRDTAAFQAMKKRVPVPI